MPSVADLLLLQNSIKRDPTGYSDEFALQWRHYEACLSLLELSPDNPPPDLVPTLGLVAQVASQYPAQTATFVPRLSALLESRADALNAEVRLAATRALILQRSRRLLTSTALLPLLFRLLRVPDKTLRALVFRHVVADLKAAKKGSRDVSLARAAQGFMYVAVRDEHEGAARRAVGLLAEMWRRRIWRDARTVDVVASAVDHPSPRVVEAALRFFAGADADKAEGEEDSDDEPEKSRVAAPTREEIYSAHHKGTLSTKKKKQRKIKRALASVKRAERREQ
ncbi:hypothetical protein H632_c2857p0, partial [Helicosporidium sp. ATCC 50920]